MGSEVYELTIDDVLTIFEEIVGISRFQGLRSRQLLESAVHAPFQTFDGAYLYNSLFTMAAALMRSISENQPFTDNNKRVAWIATVAFLAFNGFDLRLDANSSLRLMTAIAVDHLEIREIAEILLQNTVSVETENA